MIIDLISAEHSLHARKAYRGLAGDRRIGGETCTGATWERCLFQTNGCVAAEAVQFARRLYTVLTNVLLPPCAADGAAAADADDATARDTVVMHTQGTTASHAVQNTLIRN